MTSVCVWNCFDFGFSLYVYVVCLLCCGFCQSIHLLWLSLFRCSCFCSHALFSATLIIQIIHLLQCLPGPRKTHRDISLWIPPSCSAPNLVFCPNYRAAISNPSTFCVLTRYYSVHLGVQSTYLTLEGLYCWSSQQNRTHLLHSDSADMVSFSHHSDSQGFPLMSEKTSVVWVRGSTLVVPFILWNCCFAVQSIWNQSACTTGYSKTILDIELSCHWW